MRLLGAVGAGGGLGMGVAVQTDMAMPPILKFGTEEQKQEWLVPAIKGNAILCLGITEPDAGSDVAGIKTRAVKDGDSYVVSGSKAFISGGGANEIYVCMVRTGQDGPKGISCLVIEKDMPGVSFGAQEKKLGWHSQPTAQVNFDEVRVPAENLVGGEDGIDDGGLSLSRVLPAPKGIFLEGVGQVFRGDSENVFASQRRSQA